MKKNYLSILKLAIFTAVLAMFVGNAAAFTNITAQEAYDMVCSGAADLIDVRTLEEAVWVGSPACEPGGMPVGYLIPWQMFKGVDGSGKSIMEPNSDFIELVKDTFDYDRPLITMCRSGHRSTEAAKLLESHGFVNVYEIDNYLKEQESPPGGNGGFQGSNYSNNYEGYRGYPDRLLSGHHNPVKITVETDTDRIINPDASVSWMDTGLPITQKIDLTKIPTIE